MKTYNLLARADKYVQQVAKEYLPRPQFAFEQTLSDSVKLKFVYNDDADICFVFDVEDVTVDVYCNYLSDSVKGYVYAQDAAKAARVLREHFAVEAKVVNDESNSFYYYCE
jgi:hypothetical protein